MEILSESLPETKDVAQKILDNLRKDRDTAFVVAFYGDLGSGKTTIIQFLGKLIGVKKDILSPTFVIEKIYNLDDKEFGKLIHIDAYRIDKPEELLDLGWENIIKDKNNLIVVEWADKIESILPEGTMRIHMEFVDKNKRSIKW
jgi:tRNA threonylcarbamoyladenosine biosynthesis protein TsaE